MWVKMLTDQIKAGGIYLKGQTLDLPERIVEKFDEGSYETTCAPWDRNVPPEQLRLREVQAKVKSLDKEADKVAADLKKFRSYVVELEKHQKYLAKQSKAAAEELDEAKKAIEDAAAAKASEKEAARKAANDAKAADEPVFPEPPKSVDIGEAQTSEEEKIDGPEKKETQKSKAKSKTNKSSTQG